jgi:hypothetical protein
MWLQHFTQITQGLLRGGLLLGSLGLLRAGEWTSVASVCTVDEASTSKVQTSGADLRFTNMAVGHRFSCSQVAAKTAIS